MLRPREKIIAQAHDEIMPDLGYSDITKGVFYSLLMNTYVGVGEIVMIRDDQIKTVCRWFRADHRAKQRAVDILKGLGVVVTERDEGP